MSRDSNTSRPASDGASVLQCVNVDIWTAEGPTVRAFFVPLPTRMIIVKLGDGALWINSPVAVSRETLEEIVELGPVRYLVAPTTLHLWRLAQWHTLFPQAQLWGPPKMPRGFASAAFARIAQIPRGLARVASAGYLQDTPPAAWAGDVEQLVFRGNCLIEEAEFLHKKSRTLILTDFIQNYRAEDGDFVSNLVKRAGGVLNGGVPRDVRWSFTNRLLARASLEKMLSWDFNKVIVAHGLCVDRDAKAFVEDAFRWLKS